MVSTLSLVIIFVAIAMLVARRGLPSGQPRSPIEPRRVRRSLAGPRKTAGSGERAIPAAGAEGDPTAASAGDDEGDHVVGTGPRSEEATLELLMREFAEGRLSLEEYERRLDELYRTGGA